MTKALEYRDLTAAGATSYMLRHQEVDSFVRSALECSVYVSPLEPGLTHAELLETGQPLGYLAGEIGDALSRNGSQYFDKTPRLQPDGLAIALAWQAGFLHQEPDYRNYDALDFIFSQFHELIRREGLAAARIERSVIVERAIAGGLDRIAVEAELTILLLTVRIPRDREQGFHGMVNTDSTAT